MGGLSKIVGGVALVPAFLALGLRGRVPLPITAGLTHIAAVGFLVSWASSDRACRYTTWLLGKSSDGLLPLHSLVFFPYHLGLRLKLFVQRRKSTEPLYDQVTSKLWIGGWPEQASWLPPVSSVVDVTCELPKTHHHRYLCLPVWDTQAPSTAQIQQGVEWVRRELGKGHSVYIHCAHGHGRSATVLAAVLIATGQAATAEEAVALMRAARPRVRLNKPQAAALKAWIAATPDAATASAAAAAEEQEAACRPATQAAGGKAHVTVASGSGAGKK